MRVMENPASLHNSLKVQTKELHQKAHSIPYIKNLLNDNVQKESYISHLRTFAIMYGTLERQLLVTKNTDIKSIIEGYLPKLPLILGDLKSLHSNEIKDIIPAIEKALAVADKILLYSEKSPFRLIGFLYTLDGSLNGGSVFKSHLKNAFNLRDNQGISYFSAFNDDYKIFWKNFTDKLNNAIKSESIKEDILVSSEEIFHDLIGIYNCLFPFAENDLKQHITSLNPEAGNFPISTNPLEIEAAIIAGQKCWNEFPYYDQRYGERGKRFTVSDSVWLINLCDLPQELANSQVKWLTDLLANRGMPSYTMEVQLNFMYKELTERVYENESKYKKLKIAADQLKKSREKKIASALFDKCNFIFTEFCQELNVKESGMTNTGKLIASSIVDFENGIRESEYDFKSWIMNNKRFSGDWVLAVERTYSEIIKLKESEK